MGDEFPGVGGLGSGDDFFFAGVAHFGDLDIEIQCLARKRVIGIDVDHGRANLDHGDLVHALL